MLSTTLTIVGLIFTVRALPTITCASQSDCTIICDELDPINGCAARTIDASDSKSLNLICLSSQNEFYGGCQFSEVICPTSSNSSCNIQCHDHYGCYYTTIHSETTGEVTVECSDEMTSCLKPLLFANDSNSVEISCGANSCDEFQIYAQNATKVNLLCDGNYACSDIDLYANNAYNVDVFARGSFALFSSHVFAPHSNNLHLFCAGRHSQYACYKAFIFPPKRELVPRAQIECQGHGCKDQLYFYSKDGALDLDISLNSCTECDGSSDCIDNWYFYCDYLTFDTFTGDSCDSNDCNCESAVGKMDAQSTDEFSECKLFEFDYECKGSTDCIIDCGTDFTDGCANKVISGNNASSLHVICSGEHTLCESARIYCPYVDESRCVVDCLGIESCGNTEIHVVNRNNGTLNVTCSGVNACTQSNIYGDHNSYVSVNCISYHSCNNVTVTANDANNISILCDVDSTQSSYSACNKVQLFALNVKNEVELVCAGDHSCYYMDIYANYSNNIIVDTIGDYATYYGNVFAQNASNMLISCKSRYRDYGCYRTKFYISSVYTAIECEGHGCYYLSLYSHQGFTDINDIYMYSCNVCSSIYDCISSWNMYCDSSYSTSVTVYGSSSCYYSDCNCREAWTNHETNFHFIVDTNDTLGCEILRPDASCPDDQDCVLECSSSNPCDRNIIMGNNATSLTVNCIDSRSCQYAKIYCPESKNSECNILCTGYYGCENAIIYGSQGNRVNLLCTGSGSCEDSGIFIEDVSSANITCNNINGWEACSSMNIEAGFANNLLLNCLKEDSCRYTSVHVDNANDVAINCIGPEACYSIDIYGNNARNISVYGIGKNTLHYGVIYAQNVSNAMLTCESYKGDGAGCGNAKLYVPQNGNRMRIKCTGYGCDALSFYSERGMKDVTNISLNGDHQCIAAELCIDEWNLHCGSSYYTKTTQFTGSQCIDNNCDCDAFELQMAESWLVGTGDLVGDITCAANQNCVVTSQNGDLEDAIIDGRRASSLSVECGGWDRCDGAQIYCPETINSACSVTCSYYSSCNKATIIGSKNTALDISAIGDSSFTYATVWTPDTHQLTLNCSGESSCQYTAVYASEAYRVNLHCSDRYACSNIGLHANNANHVSVFIANGYRALYNGDINAYNASDFSLTCVGEDTYYGCYYAKIVFPPNERTTLNCYGFGCSKLNAYVSGGMNSLALSTIVMNGCGMCHTPSECISSWTLHCSSSDTYTTFTGTECGYDSYCNCNGNTNLLSNNFINSITSHCLLINTARPTEEPTAKPSVSPTNAIVVTDTTTNAPTISPTEEATTSIATSEYAPYEKIVDPSEDIDTTTFIVIVTILCAVIVFLIVVVSIFWYCQQKDNEDVEKHQEKTEYVKVVPLSTVGAVPTATEVALLEDEEEETNFEGKTNTQSAQSE